MPISLRPRHAVNHVSLGTVCHMAAALRGAGLRRWSGPFDWVFSTPALVADCLRADFAGYLDLARIESVPPERLAAGSRRQARHPDFEERYRVPILFNHHDPIGHLADRLALRRSIGRLRRALGPGQANIFYLMRMDVPFAEGEIADLVAAVAAHPARSSLVVLDVRTDAATMPRSFAVGAPRAGAVPVVRADITVGSRWLGLAFADPADDRMLLEAVSAAAIAAGPPAGVRTGPLAGRLLGPLLGLASRVGSGGSRVGSGGRRRGGG